MKPLLAFLALLSVGINSVVACPVVVHNRAVSTPYVSPVVVSEVYPSTATTSTEIHVTVTQALYSAFLAPAIQVPYVQPPVPPAALIQQTPLVPLAVPAAPACPAPMPAAALSQGDCAQILAEIRGMKADIAALKSGQVQPLAAPMPGAKPDALAPPPNSRQPVAALVTNCASCHTASKLAGRAPAFFDAAGLSTMTVQQIVKARKRVKDSRMPPPESAQAKAATPESLNECLEGLDALEEATVETKVTPAP